MVTPYDSFGNPGANGGRFAAELAQEEGGPPDADPIPCQVIESTTGGLPALLAPTVSEQDAREGGRSSTVAPVLRLQDA